MKIRWIVFASLLQFFIDDTIEESTTFGALTESPVTIFSTLQRSDNETFIDILQQGFSFNELNAINETSLDTVNVTISNVHQRFFAVNATRANEETDEKETPIDGTTYNYENLTTIDSTILRGLFDDKIGRNATSEIVENLDETSKKSTEIGRGITIEGNEETTVSDVSKPTTENRTLSSIENRDDNSTDKIGNLTERIMIEESANTTKNISSIVTTSHPKKIFNGEAETSTRNRSLSQVEAKNTTSVSSDRPILENNEAKRDNETTAILRMMEDAGDVTTSEIQSIVDKMKNLSPERRKYVTRKIDRLIEKTMNGEKINDKKDIDGNIDAGYCRCCRRRCGYLQKGRYRDSRRIKVSKKKNTDYPRHLAKNMRRTISETEEFAAVHSSQRTTLPEPTSTTTVQPTVTEAITITTTTKATKTEAATTTTEAATTTTEAAATTTTEAATTTTEAATTTTEATTTTTEATTTTTEATTTTTEASTSTATEASSSTATESSPSTGTEVSTLRTKKTRVSRRRRKHRKKVPKVYRRKMDIEIAKKKCNRRRRKMRKESTYTEEEDNGIDEPKEQSYYRKKFEDIEEPLDLTTNDDGFDGAVTERMDATVTSMKVQ